MVAGSGRGEVRLHRRACLSCPEPAGHRKGQALHRAWQDAAGLTSHWPQSFGQPCVHTLAICRAIEPQRQRSDGMSAMRTLLPGGPAVAGPCASVSNSGRRGMMFALPAACRCACRAARRWSSMEAPLHPQMQLCWPCAQCCGLRACRSDTRSKRERSSAGTRWRLPVGRSRSAPSPTSRSRAAAALDRRAPLRAGRRSSRGRCWSTTTAAASSPATSTPTTACAGASAATPTCTSSRSTTARARASVPGGGRDALAAFRWALRTRRRARRAARQGRGRRRQRRRQSRGGRLPEGGGRWRTCALRADPALSADSTAPRRGRRWSCSATAFSSAAPTSTGITCSTPARPWRSLTRRRIRSAPKISPALRRR